MFPSGSHDLVDQFLCVCIGILVEYANDTLAAKLGAVFVLVLINTIGNQAEYVPRLKDRDNRGLLV